MPLFSQRSLKHTFIRTNCYTEFPRWRCGNHVDGNNDPDRFYLPAIRRGFGTYGLAVSEWLLTITMSALIYGIVAIANYFNVKLSMFRGLPSTAVLA